MKNSNLFKASTLQIQQQASTDRGYRGGLGRLFSHFFVRENAYEQVTIGIGFGFTSDWLRKWRAIF